MDHDCRPLARRLRRSDRRAGPTRAGRGPHQQSGDRLAHRSPRRLARADPSRRDRHVHRVQGRRPRGAAKGVAGRGPLPRGAAGQPGRHRGPPPHDDDSPRTPRPGHRSGMAAAQPVDQVSNPDARRARRPADRYPRSRPGDQNSSRSRTPASPTPAPKAPTASSKPSPATPTASATPKTNAYAPAPPPPDATADTSTPPNFEEPLSRHSRPAATRRAGWPVACGPSPRAACASPGGSGPDSQPPVSGRISL